MALRASFYPSFSSHHYFRGSFRCLSGPLSAQLPQRPSQLPPRPSELSPTPSKLLPKSSQLRLIKGPPSSFPSKAFPAPIQVPQLRLIKGPDFLKFDLGALQWGTPRGSPGGSKIVIARPPRSNFNKPLDSPIKNPLGGYRAKFQPIRPSSLS